MDLFPAIDLRGGRAVRLHQGDYAQETVYGDDPVRVACSFADAGARWIHLVDLDAARTGVPTNREIVAAITAAVAGRAHVQAGGGVRDLAGARALADAGVDRIVMGTAALADPGLVAQVADVVPVAVGLDHRAGVLAYHGWTASSGVRVLDALDRFPRASAFVVTDISRDGTLTGPDLAGLAEVAATSPLPVIASGGVAGLDDLRALRTVPGVSGVIAGKAIYEGRFSVAEALAALS
jgi:phosphoribosylformimino-5-aminoimidazole carboxamide ribotide isomerase